MCWTNKSDPWRSASEVQDLRPSTDQGLLVAKRGTNAILGIYSGLYWCYWFSKNVTHAHILGWLLEIMCILLCTSPPAFHFSFHAYEAACMHTSAGETLCSCWLRSQNPVWHRECISYISEPIEGKKCFWHDRKKEKYHRWGFSLELDLLPACSTSCFLMRNANNLFKETTGRM